MKRVKILIGVLTLFLLISFVYLYKVVNKKKAPLEIKADRNYRLLPEEKAMLQEGDIILRRGEGFVSSVINNLNEAEYQISHCAILVKKDSVNWNVVHTVSSDLSDVDGVQTENLDRFTGESVKNTLVVLRCKADSTQRAAIGERARYYLNKQIHFDNSFDISDSTEFYCTELIYRVFLDVFKRDYFPERHNTDHPDYLTFDVFLDPKKFDVVINHQGEKVTKYMQ